MKTPEQLRSEWELVLKKISVTSFDKKEFETKIADYWLGIIKERESKLLEDIKALAERAPEGSKFGRVVPLIDIEKYESEKLK